MVPGSLYAPSDLRLAGSGGLSLDTRVKGDPVSRALPQVGGENMQAWYCQQRAPKSPE